MQRILLAGAFLFVAAWSDVLAADDDPAKEKEKLIGNWSVVKLEDEGVELSAEILKEIKIEITADTFVLKSDTMESSAKYAADPAKKPHPEFDLTPTAGQDKDKVFLGIYKFEGDQLFICANKKSDLERPAEFSTKINSGRTLVILKKQ